MKITNHRWIQGIGRLALMAAAVLAIAGAPGTRKADYARVIRAEHPVLYLRLDEPPGAAIAADLSPSHLDGTYGAGRAAGLVPGISTNSLSSAQVGGGATVTIPFSALLCPVNSDGLTGGAWSAECWVRPGVAVAMEDQSPLSMRGPAGAGAYAAGSGWSFDQASGGGWRLTVCTGSGLVGLVASAPIVAGQWTYLAATWDGTSAVWYVNGVAAKSAAVSGYVANPNTPGIIGANAPGQGWFAGAVAEAALYANALGVSAVSNHFSTGIKCLKAKGITVGQAAANP